MSSREVEIQYDEPVQHIDNDREEGVEIPLDRINPETLSTLINEFVTPECEEVGDASIPWTRRLSRSGSS
jgi:hypothetical protein